MTKTDDVERLRDYLAHPNQPFSMLGRDALTRILDRLEAAEARALKAENALIYERRSHDQD